MPRQAMHPGSRYPVEAVLELLGSGMSFDETLGDHPDLEREDISR
jgi:uncharacterized protein (DUF433 family)